MAKEKTERRTKTTKTVIADSGGGSQSRGQDPNPGQGPVVLSERERKAPAPKGVSKYVQNLLALYAPHIIPQVLANVHKGLLERDGAAQRDAMTIYGMSGTKASPVFQNFVNANASAGASAASSSGGGRRGFDSFIRRRDAERRAAAQTVDVPALPAAEE